MKNFLSFLILLLSNSFIFFSCNQSDEEITQLKLWYKEPANARIPDNENPWIDDPEWLKALPLGNGSLGAMVYGDVNFERIQLNEESMWSGSPDENNNPESFPAISKIRKLLFDEKYREASELTAKTQICKSYGSGNGNGTNVPYGSFQTLGNLWINFSNNTEYGNYYRELNLNNAVAKVSYTQNRVNFTREIFTSFPDQVMVLKLTSDKPKQISFECKLDRPERFSTKTENNQLIMFGELNDGKGGNGLKYISRLKIKNVNGKINYTDSSIVIENSDEVILFLTASTNYLLKYPNYIGRDYINISNTNIENAFKKDYEELYYNHIRDYQKYYNRVNFNLTNNEKDTIPTDLRVQNFKENKNDLKLVELIFQYGRYLLISSSRPGKLPANLQGIWTNKIQTPWNGDYHTNINVQMNYWPAEITNLSEMHLPLFNLIESLVIPGKQTAKVHYNANGWVIHPITNVWGYTAPGENSSWGMHLSASAWLCSHIGEHYKFTLDKNFLKEMFPVLKSSVEFYLDWLVEDPKSGKLVSGPAGSPENSFIAPDGSKCQISMGPAHDQQLIWNLFNNFIFTCKELKISNEFVEKVKISQERLQGPKIGSDGRLLEWNEEFQEVEPGHRHMSHLIALHPGSQISLSKTPELAKAAKKSLQYRIDNGGGHTGWSAAWLINLYARLQESENAKKSLDVVLSKSTSPNLFGQHPPFQMDANFGTTSGIAEMLLTSNDDEIQLLPALPKEWNNGKVSGLCAKGGFEVDMKWKNGELIYAKIISKNGKFCKVKYKNKVASFNTEIGDEYYPFND
ncbi:MAG: glycoside hydrolase family 95 protein [Ignavibacteriae bacterium]|nr:glycoside hydrolase family 95 protein [Ignavibacteriota bacterium]